MLLIAAFITLVMQDFIDSGIIMAVVLINAVIGYIQNSNLISMKLLLTLFLIVNLSQFSVLNEPYENPEEEVEQLVRDFFEAMRNSDSAAMESLLTSDATLNNVAQSAQDSTILRKTDISAFLNSVGNTEAGTLDEQLTSLEAHVDGNLATAWMEYRFYNGGEFSHCGVNTMNLIRQSSGWKIFSIVDTRRQENC